MSYLSLRAFIPRRAFPLGCRFMSNNDNKEPPSTGAKDADEVVDVIVKEIPDSKVHWEYSQDSSSARVYDKKPIKLLCREGRMYMWYVIVILIFLSRN